MEYMQPINPKIPQEEGRSKVSVKKKRKEKINI